MHPKDDTYIQKMALKLQFQPVLDTTISVSEFWPGFTHSTIAIAVDPQLYRQSMQLIQILLECTAPHQ